jgi:hypothetical protein
VICSALTYGTNRLLLAPVFKRKLRLGVRVFSRPVDPSKNRLLAALPSHEVERLLPTFQQISFSLGDVVYEFSGHLDYVYFPTTAIVSLLYTMENGATAEMGLTGNDGVVGIALFMGGGTMPNRAVVQSAGDAIRMKAKGAAGRIRPGW